MRNTLLTHRTWFVGCMSKFYTLWPYKCLWRSCLDLDLVYNNVLRKFAMPHTPTPEKVI